MKKMIFLMLALLMLSTASMNAQVRIGGIDDPNVSAVLDLNATDNSNDGTLGLALPRVELNSTDLPAPLLEHVKGMTVYNTKPQNDVKEGIYYNNGLRWILINSEAFVIQAGSGLEITGSGTVASPSTVGIATGGVTSTHIADGTVALADLANNSVNSDKIVNESITSADILNATVALADLADNSVNSAKIVNESITSADILNATVALADLADHSVNSAKIVDGSIASVDILDGTVALADLASNSVNSDKIVNESITSADILNGTIALADLASNSVNSTKIADGSIALADLADNSVNSAKIVNGSIVAADLGQMGAGTGQFLRWNGSAWAASGGWHGVKMIYDAIITWTTTGNSITLSVPDASYYGWCITWGRNYNTYTNTGEITIQTVDGSSITAGSKCGAITCYRLN
jgi:hypothetical protein